MNAQKLDDTEDTLERNLRVITVRDVPQHPRRIAIIDEDYHWRYPHGLKTNRAYGAAALVRVINPDCK